MKLVKEIGNSLITTPRHSPLPPAIMAAISQQIRFSIDTTVYCAVRNLGITEDDLRHCFRAMKARGLLDSDPHRVDTVSQPDSEATEEASEPEEASEEDSEEDNKEEEEEEDEEAKAPSPVSVTVSESRYHGMHRPQLLDLVRKRGLQAKFSNSYAGKDRLKHGLGFAQLAIKHFRELLEDDDNAAASSAAGAAADTVTVD